MKYQHKPTIVLARQFFKSDMQSILNNSGGRNRYEDTLNPVVDGFDEEQIYERNGEYYLRESNCGMPLKDGDFIIENEKGNIRKVGKVEFYNLYERMED